MNRFICWTFPVALAVLPSQHHLLDYDVDLEVDPSNRYAKVWEDFLQQRGSKAFEQTYEAWHAGLRMILPDLFGANATSNQQRWYQALLSGHPAAAAELAALAQRLHGTDAAALSTAVSMYPLLNIAPKGPTDAPGLATAPSACTSSLLSQPGSVLHGRSLDYEPRDPIAETTVVVRYRKDGKVQYTCLQPLVWTTALQWFTCVRPRAFSLSVNARSRGIHMESNTSFEELLRRVESGAYLLGELAEEAMSARTYADALRILSSLPVVSSNYFILAGADQGQGAIVTRFGNTSSADVWSLNSSSELSDGQPPWLRVQTNADHWVPYGDTYATHRRQHLLDMLTSGKTPASKEHFKEAYFVSNALPGSQNRTTPEDTGAILRPTTIATIFLNPSSSETDLSEWYVWNETPKILPPREAERLWL